jgi:hypothetical protein
MRLPLLALALSGAALMAASPQMILSPDAVVMPPSKTAALLRQCSRQTPPPGSAGWMPRMADIVALERSLPKALHAQSPDKNQNWLSAPAGWRRQYVGMIRGGKRLIYGNFFPKRTDEGNGWRSVPMIICDGGPVFFGVEFDVQTQRFTHLAFNGMV